MMGGVDDGGDGWMGAWLAGCGGLIKEGRNASGGWVDDAWMGGWMDGFGGRYRMRIAGVSSYS